MGHAEGMYIGLLVVAGVALLAWRWQAVKDWAERVAWRPYREAGLLVGLLLLAFCVVSLLTNNSPWPATVVVPLTAWLIFCAPSPAASSRRSPWSSPGLPASRSRCRGRRHRPHTGAPGTAAETSVLKAWTGDFAGVGREDYEYPDPGTAHRRRPAQTNGPRSDPAPRLVAAAVD